MTLAFRLPQSAFRFLPSAFETSGSTGSGMKAERGWRHGGKQWKLWLRVKPIGVKTKVKHDTID